MRNFLSGMTALLGLIAASVLGTLLSTGVASAATIVFVTQHSGVDFTQTRTNGYHKFVDAGLQVWTDTNEVSCTPAPCKNKVAGYLDVAPEALATVAVGPEPTLNYAAQFGSVPGYQLVVEGVDEDGLDRTWILVGEPGAYGDKWWAASCADFCTKLKMPASGGGGSPYQGTLDEWTAAQPNGVVTRIGFSLGSGAYGRGVVKSLTLLDKYYTFKLHHKPVSVTPTTNPPTSTTSVTTPSNPPGSEITVTPPTTTTTTTSPWTTSTLPVTKVHYANCTEVIAAGKAPIHVGTPGYAPRLDEDGDGIGCELEERVTNAGLASTGANVGAVVAVGTLLLFGGTAVAVAVRRRRFDG